jgi:sugar O-acyltransferase (sialic acid O-acetyltransferase NeuD family)
VIIIGNSGAARECYWLLQDIAPESEDLTFKGFLSFEGFRGDLRELAPLQLGTDDKYTPADEDVFVIGIGLPALRLKAFAKLKQRGWKFMNLVHPTVKLTGRVVLGEGNILAQNCHMSCNTVLGDANYLNGSIVVGHDAHIGHGNFFGPFSQILGETNIGSGNSFGVNSVVLAGAAIGDNNTIAPGAYVYKGCGDNCRMAGNPAINIA